MAALGRRRDGVAVGLRIFTCSASLQPGTWGGVGGKGRWTAVAVPPQTESAGGRGKIATVVSGGACKVTAMHQTSNASQTGRSGNLADLY